MFASVRLRCKFVLLAGTLGMLCCDFGWPVSAFGQVQVLTQHNDVRRTGANTNETWLNASNVNANTFGKLFTQGVDGYIVGQPLYLPAVQFPDNSTHNVVYVVTQHDSVYAFDADSLQSPLWSTSFIDAGNGITSVPNNAVTDFGCGGTGFLEIGIVSTPVIDPNTGTLFVLAKTSENGTYVFRLHALSVTTGLDVATPTVITASVSTNSGPLQFNPAIQMQRPALLLSNGTVYIGFGSNGCDTYAYHGWLLAYDSSSLQQVGAFVTTPNGARGAIWQGGGGLAADGDGSIFLATANGAFTADAGGSDYGDSLLHLSPASSGLSVLDYFTPFNQQALSDDDVDLGSGGVVLLPDQDIPHTHQLLGGGKEGTLYLVDRDNMGGFNAADDSQIVQSIPGASAGELIGAPAYWNGRVYISGEDDSIRAFTLSNLLSTAPVSQTTVVGPSPSSMSISANGSTNGIVWAVPLNSVATLYAYDATDLGTILYTSAQAPNQRDLIGGIPKFVAPTIANGRVYLGGKSALTVLGLLPTIAVMTGNNQSALVGTTLPVMLQVQAVDAYQGQPIASVSVTCKDGGVGGAFSAAMPMITDGQGQASTSYTLPKKAQTVTIVCTSNGYATGTFTETGIAGPVSGAIIVSGNNQTGPASTQLPAPLVMQVVDPFGYGVPGVGVTFSDGGAGGTFSPTSATTDGLGEISTLYTTGNAVGTVVVSATTTGLSPLKFTVTVGTPSPNFTLSSPTGTLSVVQGNNVPATITVNPTGGFSGSVTLSASGLPSGVTAAFSPNPATGTSTLTLSAGSSATIGTATITVTGTSGTITQTAAVQLVVTAAPAFTLSSASGALSVAQGSSMPNTITVTASGGFAGSVTLSASGLPSGVTAAFSPNPATGTSTLTLSAGSSATIGTATITVTGTSGALTQTTTFDLSVTAPGTYSLKAGTPNPTSISPGGVSKVALTVTPSSGYTGSVALSCSITPVVTPAPTCAIGGTNPLTVGAAGASATLTFTTVGPSAAILRHSPSTLYASWLPLPVLGLIAFGLGSGPSRRKKLLGGCTLLTVLACILILPACGGGTTPHGSGGTPAGTYSITITGKDANNVTQANTAPVVSITVN